MPLGSSQCFKSPPTINHPELVPPLCCSSLSLQLGPVGMRVPKIVLSPGPAAVPLAELSPRSLCPCATATMVKCLVKIKTRVSVHLWLINHCCREVRVRVLALGPRLLSRALGILPLLPAVPSLGHDAPGPGDPPEPGNAAPGGLGSPGASTGLPMHRGTTGSC